MVSKQNNEPDKSSFLLAMGGAILIGANQGCAPGESYEDLVIIDATTGQEITGEIRTKMMRVLANAEERYDLFSSGVPEVHVHPDENISEVCEVSVTIDGCFDPKTNVVNLPERVAYSLDNPSSQRIVYHEFAHSGQERNASGQYDLGNEEFLASFGDLPWHGEYSAQPDVEYDTDECISFYSCKDQEEGHAEFVGHNLAHPLAYLARPDLYAQRDLGEDLFGTIDAHPVEIDYLNDLQTSYEESASRNNFLLYREQEGSLQVIQGRESSSGSYYYLTITNEDGPEEEKTIHAYNLDTLTLSSSERGFIFAEESEDRSLELNEFDLETEENQSLGTFEMSPEFDYVPGKSCSFRTAEFENRIYLLPTYVTGRTFVRLPYYDRETGDLEYLDTDIPTPVGEQLYIKGHSNVAGGKVALELDFMLYTVDLVTGEAIGEGSTGYSGAKADQLALNEGGDIYASGKIYTSSDSEDIYPLLHAQAGDFQLSMNSVPEGDSWDSTQNWGYPVTAIGERVFFTQTIDNSDGTADQTPVEVRPH
jgi:hypothetical protein